MKERLQKLISASGLMSRRAAEEAILSGRVLLNGNTAVPGDKADPDEDRILVDGAPLPCAGKKLYVMLNQSGENRRIGVNTNFNGVLTDVLNDNAQYDCNGWFEVDVPPMSSMILVENDGSFRIDFDTESEPVEQVIQKDSVTEAVEEEPELIPEEIVKGKYRHFKGNEYEVIDFAKDSETTEKMVVYRALYGDHELWVRPYEMFREIIERDGKKIRRFEKID